MLLRELFEARRNPEQNPKTSINQAITQAADTNDTIAGTSNGFVSFTSIDKLGINPKSVYDTPFGIYAYPIAYASKVVGDTSAATALPFAGESEFANLFTVHGNIINIATIDATKVNEYCQRIGSYVKKIDTGLVDLLKTTIVEAKTKALVSLVGGQFWYITKNMSERIAEITNNHPGVVWNKLFRAIGIDGVVDIRGTRGMKIIHEKEPCQAVFFSTAVIVNNRRIYNRYSPEQQQQSTQRGQEISTSTEEARVALNAAKNYDEVVGVLDKVGYSMIRLVRDPKIRERIIQSNPDAIQYINRPSKHEQLIALNKNFKQSLMMIRRPDDQVVAQALLNNPTNDNVRTLLGWKKHLSTPIQVAIATIDPRSVKDIRGLSRAAIQAAIDNWKPPANIPDFMKAAASKIPKWLDELANQFNAK